METKISLLLKPADRDPQFLEVIGDHDLLRKPLTQIHNLILTNEASISRSFNVLETLMRSQFNIPDSVSIDVDRVTWMHPLSLGVVDRLDQALSEEGWDNVKFTGLILGDRGNVLEYVGVSRTKKKKSHEYKDPRDVVRDQYFGQQRGYDPTY